VQNVVVWYERMGMSADEIATAYGITLADVYAALTYYHDHRAEIDQAMRQDAAFVADLRQRTPSKIRKERDG
jgi:transposase